MPTKAIQDGDAGQEDTSYDVSEVLSKILDETKNPYSRAIWYYEFQVAMAFCRGYAKNRTADRLTICVSRKRLRRARLFAAMRFIQVLSKRSMGVKRASFEGMLADLISTDHREVYGQFLRDNGWAHVRHLPSARAFHARIVKHRKEARQAAIVVDVFLRADVSRLPEHRTLSFELAYAVVPPLEQTINPASRIPSSRASLAERRKKFWPIAIFAYLDQIQGYQIGPPSVAGKNFVEKMLELVNDRDTLLHIISGYRDVHTQLNEHRIIDLPALHVQVSDALPESEIHVNPLPQEAQEIINSYHKRGRVRAKQQFDQIVKPSSKSIDR